MRFYEVPHAQIHAPNLVYDNRGTPRMDGGFESPSGYRCQTSDYFLDICFFDLEGRMAF